MEIGPILVDLVFGIIAILFLTFDIRKRDIGMRFFYLWTFALVFGYFFFEIFGISLVILLYVVWSRLFFPSEESSTAE